MSQIGTLDIEQIKTQTEIVAYISRFVDLQKSGNRYVGNCPFHAEKTASFTVYPKTYSWHCFGCKASGDVIAFEMRHANVDFKTACVNLSSSQLTNGATSRNHTSPALPPKDEVVVDYATRVTVYRELLQKCRPVCTTLHSSTHWLMKEKRISFETQMAFKLHWFESKRYHAIDAHLKKLFDVQVLRGLGLLNRKDNLVFYRHRLLFPFWSPQGDPYYIQGRNINTKDTGTRFHNPGEIPSLYNFPALLAAQREHKPLFICEGCTDTLTLSAHGYHAVGIIGAAGFKCEWISLLKGLAVYLAFDGDHAGQTNAQKLCRLFAQAEQPLPHILPIPANEDINSLLTKYVVQ